MARYRSFRSPPLALAALLLLLTAGTVLGAQRAPKTKTAPTPSSASSPTLFSTDWSGVAAGELPAGVTLVAGTAQVTSAQGRQFLQVTDSASLDLQLAAELPDAYTIEFDMQVPASTAYAVEIRPEAAGGSPAGYAGVSRRMSHPVALCGAIGSGIYAASEAQSQQKRYPDAEASQLRKCKIEVDASGVRVLYAGTVAANAIGGDLGTGTQVRLHIPASASAPALIGPIKVAAAAGTSVAGKAGKPVLAATRTLLELQAAGLQASGTVLSVEGGEPVADMVEQPGANGVDIHPGPVHYTDIVAKVALTDFGKLIAQWAATPQAPLDGRLVGADFQYRAQYYRTFSQARLAEVAFPALDGASKDHGYLRLRITPPTTQLQAPPPGSSVAGKIGQKQKPWLVSAFTLDIPGLATQRVSRIEPFKIALKTRANGTAFFAGTRLTVTFAAVDAGSWLDWQEQFLLKGPGPERTLELKLLSSNLKDTLMELKGSGVGLLSLAAVAQEDNEKTARLRAELYVEKWQIVPHIGGAQ
jgi:hypothetical protein